jgi:hypothetical protein
VQPHSSSRYFPWLWTVTYFISVPKGTNGQSQLYKVWPLQDDAWLLIAYILSLLCSSQKTPHHLLLPWNWSNYHICLEHRLLPFQRTIFCWSLKSPLLAGVRA